MAFPYFRWSTIWSAVAALAAVGLLLVALKPEIVRYWRPTVTRAEYYPWTVPGHYGELVKQLDDEKKAGKQDTGAWSKLYDDLAAAFKSQLDPRNLHWYARVDLQNDTSGPFTGCVLVACPRAFVNYSIGDQKFVRETDDLGRMKLDADLHRNQTITFELWGSNLPEGSISFDFAECVPVVAYSTVVRKLTWWDTALTIAVMGLLAVAMFDRVKRIQAQRRGNTAAANSGKRGGEPT